MTLIVTIATSDVRPPPSVAKTPNVWVGTSSKFKFPFTVTSPLLLLRENGDVPLTKLYVTVPLFPLSGSIAVTVNTDVPSELPSTIEAANEFWVKTGRLSLTSWTEMITLAVSVRSPPSLATTTRLYVGWVSLSIVHLVVHAVDTTPVTGFTLNSVKYPVYTILAYVPLSWSVAYIVTRDIFGGEFSTTVA